MCTKFGYLIECGSTLLFSYFLNNYNPTSVISYCDNSKFLKTEYDSLGFEIISYGIPLKHWYNHKLKMHITDGRLKQKGFNKLFGTDYSKKHSNEYLMKIMGFVEIFDAGQSSWMWKNN